MNNLELPAAVSVVIPASNEEDTINEIVRRVVKLPFVLEAIIVDDCSTDGTRKICEQLARENSSVRYVRHQKNAGKTEALKTGIAQTTGEVVIIQDADLEYDPGEIEDVVRPIFEGHAHVVYGSRFMVRKAARVLYYYHFIANKLLTLTSNLLTNLNMTDIETGYKAFRGDIIRNMVITSKGFGFEVEVTAKIAKIKCAIYEVPISYYGRTYEEGKKIGPMDALAAFGLIFRYNLFCRPRASFKQLPEVSGVSKPRPAYTLPE